MKATTVDTASNGGESQDLPGNVAQQTVVTPANGAGDGLTPIDPALLATAIGQAAEAIVITDTEGRIQFVNPAFTSMTGYTAHEVMGQNPRLLKSSLQDPTYYESLWKTILAGEVWRGELINRRKDSTFYAEQMTITPVRDSNGATTNFIAIKQDVTPRRSAEAALRLREAKLKEAEHVARLGSWEFDVSAGEFRGSEGLFHIFGWNPMATPIALGKVMEALYITDRDRVNAALEYTAQTQEPFDIEHGIVCPNGELRVARSRGQVVIEPGGKTARIVGTTLDITESKLAHTRLAQSEEKYRALISNIPDIVWTADAKGVPVFISANCEKLSGYTADELCNSLRWLENVHPDDAAAGVAAFAAFVAGGPHFDVEFRMRRKNGEWIWVHSRAITKYQKDGRVFVDGLHSDITEGKLAHERLAQSEEKYRSLVLNIPDVTWTAAVDGTTAYISPNIEKVYGFTAEEILEKGEELWLGRIHPDDSKRVIEGFQALFTEGRPFDIEYRVQHKDGRWIWIHDRALRTYEKDGVRYADGLFNNITERKRVEEALRLTQFSVENALDAVLWTDPSGRFLYANEAACRLVGCSREELLSLTVSDVDVDVSPERWPAVWEALKARGSHLLESRMQTRQGRVFPVEVAGRYLRFADQEYSFSFVRDITGRKRAEKALQASEQRYRRFVEENAAGFVRSTKDGRILDANDTAARMFGYRTADELKGRQIGELYVDSADRLRMVTLLKQQRCLTGYELPFKQPDGSAGWHLLNMSLVEEGGDEIVESTAVDITQRKRAEEALRISEKRYREFFERNQAGVLRWTPQGQILDCNASMATILGYDSARELSQQSTAEMWDDPADGKKLLRVVRKLGRVRNLELRLRSKDGRPVCTLASVYLSKKEAGHDPVLEATIIDITERKRAEQAIRESERFLQSTLDALSAHVAILDESGTIMAVNAAWNRFAAANGGKIEACSINANYLEVCDRASNESPEAARAAKGIRDLMAGKAETFGLEYPCHSPDQKRWFLLRVSRFTGDEGRRRVVLIHADITERKEAELGLLESQGELAAAQRIARIGSWRWNTLTDEAHWSDETFRIFGQKPGPLERHGARFLEMIHADDRSRVSAALTAALEGAADYNLEYRLVRPDGAVRVIHAQAEVARDEAGRPTFMRGTVHDITERKHAEEAKALLASIVESSDDAIIGKAADGTIVSWNRGAELLYGYPAAEVIGKPVSILAPSDRADEVPGILARIKRGERISHFETVRVRKDGTPVDVSLTISPIKNSAGEVAGAATIARDITERKRAEEKLRRSEAYLAESQRLSHSGSWAWNLSSEELYWSDETFRIFGFDPEQTKASIRGTFLSRIHPVDRPRVQEGLNAAAAQLTDVETEYRIVLPDGSIRHLHDVVRPVANESGEVVERFGVVSDVTERKQAEERLRLTQFSVEHASVAVFWMDAAGRIIYVNEAACRSLERSREELLSLSIPDLDPHYPQEAWRTFWEGLKARGSITFETQNETKEGRVFPVEITANYLEFDGKEYCFAFARDITERKAAEEALRESEGRFRLFVEHAPAAIAMFDRNMRYLAASRRWLEDYRLAPQEIIGRGHYEIFPEIPDRWKEIHQRCLAGAVEKCEEDPFPRADGTTDWVRWEIHPWRRSMGEVGGLILFSETITERKRAQEALRASEQRYRRFLERNAAGVIRNNMDGAIVDCNDAAARILGYESAQELKTRRSKDLYLIPGDRERTLALLREEKALVGYEFQFARKDGSPVWFLANMTLAEEDGREIIEATFIDNTDRKRAEEALRGSEEQFRQLAETIREVFFIATPDPPRLNYLSPAYEDICGRPRQEVYDRTEAWIDAVHADDREQAIGIFTRVYQGDRAKAEYRVVRPDSSVRWISAQAFPVNDSEGRLTRVVGIAEDITERKQAEETIRKSEEKYRSLVSNIPDVVWTLSADGRFAFISPTIENVSGYAVDEIGEKGARLFIESIHPDDAERVKTALEALFSKNEPYDVECRVRRKSGEWIWIHDRALATYERDGVLHADGLLSDVTIRKRAEEEMRKAKEAAEDANRAKSQFLANMSHEIRTPMNGVIGMAGLLLDTELTPEQRQYAGIVRSSGEALLTVINDILDFSRVEARKLVLEAVDFDLLAPLQYATDLLAVKARQKGLEITCQVRPGTPTLLRGDPGRLRQVLVNLLANSVKFTHSGEVAIGVGLETESEGTVTLRFTVRDTGIGFRQDKTAAIFAPFVQADGSTTRRYGGTGLGLAISKQLVEMMGGRIGAESAEGKGSTFWFTAVFEKQPQPFAPPTVAPPGLGAAKVLVVDDNATNRSLTVNLLRSWGCHSEAATNTNSAVVAMREAARSANPFRLALLDMSLPGMDGAQLGQRIAADPELRGTALVLMTSVGERTDLARLRELGFSAQVSKPIWESRLREALAAAVGEKRVEVAASSEGIRKQTGALSAVSKGRILVAEDNPTNQAVVKAMLEKFGYCADVVEDGAAALLALQLADYDLVLMDCLMPEMDGYEATRRIRVRGAGIRNPDVPIIALTAAAISGDREKCIAAGMSDYLAKPIEPEQLAEVLRKWAATPPGGREVSPPDSHSAEEQTAVFNEAEFLTRLMADKVLARTVIAGFLNDVPKQLDSLRKWIEQGDAARAGIQAHTLKGAAATVSAGALRAAAVEMQEAANSDGLGRTKALLPRLEAEFKRLEDTLRRCGWV